jgi:hypothetical protein
MYSVYIMRARDTGDTQELDDAAWQEELVFIKERARSLAEGGSTSRWRREDSYDFRRMRLPEPEPEQDDQT